MTVALPPLEPLREVARRLDAQGIVWALGGSGLLHALGLADRVRDWDLTTDAPPAAARDALADLSPTLHGNLGIHADHKVVCFDDTVEVICRFAFFGERRADARGGSPPDVIQIPTLVTGTWEGFPLGSPEAWAVAYALMAHEKAGRAEKSRALFEWSARHGDAARVRALLAQPLPDEIRDRLMELHASLAG